MADQPAPLVRAVRTLAGSVFCLPAWNEFEGWHLHLPKHAIVLFNLKPMETTMATHAASQTDCAQDHSEGRVARAIEQQTAKVPSDWFLWAAGASILGSLVCQMSGKKEDGNFIGQWAPTFLILGLYNKIVKVAGSDRHE